MKYERVHYGGTKATNCFATNSGVSFGLIHVEFVGSTPY